MYVCMYVDMLILKGTSNYDAEKLRVNKYLISLPKRSCIKIKFRIMLILI